MSSFDLLHLLSSLYFHSTLLYFRRNSISVHGSFLRALFYSKFLFLAHTREISLSKLIDTLSSYSDVPFLSPSFPVIPSLSALQSFFRKLGSKRSLHIFNLIKSDILSYGMIYDCGFPAFTKDSVIDLSSRSSIWKNSDNSSD